ncbi:MAG: zinc ribbon domain-containing protein [Bacilli bacterium]|nr:zinc ribbon domain-containing protein [Bacilli bacterium]
MWFFIGVIVFIVFCFVVYFYFRRRIRRILDKAGFVGMSLKDIIEQARLEDQENPKSLSSMDSVYLDTIKKDFPGIHINELKREAEKMILDCFQGVEDKDSSKFKGKIKSFVDSMIHDYDGKKVSFDQMKIHNTVVSSYRKEEGIATIYFATSFEYYLNVDGKSVKKQDRAKTEFIYVYDMNEVDADLKVLGIHCPNCGSPITSLGQKNCSYCGQLILEFIGRVFTCNDIVRY